MYNENLNKLKELAKEQRYYSSIGALIGWDMWQSRPKEGTPYMNDLSGFLMKESMGKFTSNESKKLYDYFKNYDVDSIQDMYAKRAIKNFIRGFERITKVPIDLQIEIENRTQEGQMVWRDAYKNSDFEMLKPYLYKVIELKTKEAEYLDNSKSTFEVLVGEFDNGLSIDKTTKAFDELKIAVIDLLKKIKETGLDYHVEELDRPITKYQVENFMIEILKKTAYNTDRSSWGEILHPLTIGIGPRDCRISTNYRTMESTIASFMHEMGHGIYNYSSNDKAIEYSIWGGTGGSIHESQSRFYEMIVGRSYEFWEHFYHLVPENLDYFKGIDLDTFYHGMNNVKPCAKRLESDELSYNLHPIIRFEIERDYFDGKIKLDDLREVWNEKYKTYLGIEPKNDSEGILSDMHWAMGYLGYFQSYTLGNIYDGQILHTILEKNPNIYEDMKVGEFSFINNFLRDNIHQYGDMFTPDELLKRVTGEEINAKYYIDYITKKFSNLYNLK